MTEAMGYTAALAPERPAGAHALTHTLALVPAVATLLRVECGAARGGDTRAGCGAARGVLAGVAVTVTLVAVTLVVATPTV